MWTGISSAFVALVGHPGVPWLSLFWLLTSSVGDVLAIRNLGLAINGGHLLQTLKHAPEVGVEVDKAVTIGLLVSEGRARMFSAIIWMHTMFVLAGVVGLSRPTPDLPVTWQGWIETALIMSVPLALIYITVVAEDIRQRTVNA